MSKTLQVRMDEELHEFLIDAAQKADPFTGNMSALARKIFSKFRSRFQRGLLAFDDFGNIVDVPPVTSRNTESYAVVQPPLHTRGPAKLSKTKQQEQKKQESKSGYRESEPPSEKRSRKRKTAKPSPKVPTTERGSDVLKHYLDLEKVNTWVLKLKSAPTSELRNEVELAIRELDERGYDGSAVVKLGIERWLGFRKEDPAIKQNRAFSLWYVLRHTTDKDGRTARLVERYSGANPRLNDYHDWRIDKVPLEKRVAANKQMASDLKSETGSPTHGTFAGPAPRSYDGPTVRRDPKVEAEITKLSNLITDCDMKISLYGSWPEMESKRDKAKSDVNRLRKSLLV